MSPVDAFGIGGAASLTLNNLAMRERRLNCIRLAAAAAVTCLTACTPGVLADPAPSEDAAPPEAQMVVPTEPEHEPYVPADVWPSDVTHPMSYSIEQIPTVVEMSIDGIGWPLPEGAEYAPDEILSDPPPGAAIREGFPESAVAYQWACSWLAVRAEAANRGDDDLVTEIDALMANFWTLPHIDYLAADGLTFREQMLEANGNDEATLNEFFAATGCGIDP